MLVGREREIAAVEALLRRVREGRHGVLVLRGEPGIGKSALLLETVRRATGITVIRVQGFQTEAEIAYAALADVRRAVAEHLPRLPTELRRALDDAVGETVPDGRLSPVAVGRAVAALLEQAVADAPVLVAVDDGNWVDEASVAALVFAARRLREAALAFAVTERLDESSGFDDLDAQVVYLPPLAPADALRLLERDYRLRTRIRRAVCRIATGNPLALHEFAAAAADGVFDPEDTVIAVGPRVAAAFGVRIDRLPEGTRRALTAVAASFTGEAAETSGALAALGLTDADLEPARVAGLVDSDGARWWMRHPIVRSVAYWRGTASERQAAHRAYAAWLTEHHAGADERRAADERAWHLAASTMPGDEATAALLGGVAEAARARGAIGAARRAHERAAELSRRADFQARMLIGAAECAQIAGDSDEALRMAAEATKRSGEAVVAAAANRLRHGIAVLRQGAAAVMDLFQADAAAVQDSDPDHAAALLAAAAAAAVSATLVADTVRLAGRGRELTAGSVGSFGPGGVAARSMYAYGLVSAGRTSEAATVLDEYLPELASADPLRHTPEAVAVTGMVLVWLGRHDAAERFLTRMVGELRAAGAEERLPLLLIPRALLALRTGDWTPGAADALEESWLLGAELGQMQVAPLAVALSARLAALRGEPRAAELAARALRMTEHTEATFYQAIAEAALGKAHLAAGRAPEAAATVSAARDRLIRAGMVEHSLWAPTLGDYVEALVRVGEYARAQAVVGEEAPRTEAGALAASVAVLYRCRAQVATTRRTARLWFQRAADVHVEVGDPFEQARTMLAWARALRHAGDRDAARRVLEPAAADLARLGARPWQWAAEVELDLASRPPVGNAHALTLQQRRVAELAAAGASNEQIARSLGVGTATVGYHLAQVFRTLGIGGRSELPGSLGP